MDIMRQRRETRAQVWGPLCSLPCRYVKRAVIATSLVTLIFATVGPRSDRWWRSQGNACVCLAVALTRRLRTLTNCFTASLAVADLLLGVLVLPFSAFVELHSSWPLGPTFCNVYTSSDVMLCTASILHLLAIGVDRYCAVSSPFTYACRVTRGRVAASLAVIWLVSLAVSFPPLHLGWNTEDGTPQNRGPGDPADRCVFELNRGYVLFDATGTFYVPLALLLFTYSRVFVVARAQARRIGAATVGRRRAPLTLAALREHKATATLSAVMGAFVTCWFPYFTVFTFQGVTGASVEANAFAVVLWLGYANSALNPLIYATLNREFRAAFVKLLRCGRPGRATPAPLP
ncbi:histamine H2 receptor-like [Lethenteron reissneri]|uniref:histamine H2 receptor-like n=1 Tax=Lethenteron reissneri TaxID=7753 RepID=UPI002AB7160E|nr:histamine H2 receptor-like [Lethenteron reissneri]